MNVGHTIESDTEKYLNYLSQTFTIPFPKIKFNYTSTKDIEKIIKSLKSKKTNGCRLSTGALPTGRTHVVVFPGTTSQLTDTQRQDHQ